MYLTAIIPRTINNMIIPMVLFPVTCFDIFMDLDAFGLSSFSGAVFWPYSFETFWLTPDDIVLLFSIVSVMFACFSGFVMFSVLEVMFLSYSGDVLFVTLVFLD